MALDQRIRAHLIDTGAVNERGLSRTPRYRHCPRGCGLVLLAAQNLGQEIWCDLYPITAAGELQALMTGRATWTRVLGELAYRHHDRITFRSADKDEVYSEHQCGMAQPEINHRHIKKRTPPDYSAPPPF